MLAHTFDIAFYIGARFEYFFAESNGGAGGSSSLNFWNLMVQPGFDIGITERMVVRPHLALGLAELHDQSCFTPTRASR